MENDNDRRIASLLVNSPNELLEFLRPFIYKIVIAKIKKNEFLLSHSEDIIQEVTIQVWKWSDKLEETDHIKFGYVVKVIKFQTINVIKKKITNEKAKVMDLTEAAIVDRPLPLDLEKLEKIIEGLPFQHKRIIKAKIQFQSDVECGQFMQMNRNTFARLFKVALEVLRKRVEDAYLTI